MPQNLHLLKIANLILLSLFFFQNLLSQYGNIFEGLSFGKKNKNLIKNSEHKL